MKLACRLSTTSNCLIAVCCFTLLTGSGRGNAADLNPMILEHIAKMPGGGEYAKYRKDLPDGARFRDLEQTVADLAKAIDVDRKGRLLALGASRTADRQGPACQR